MNTRPARRKNVKPKPTDNEASINCISKTEIDVIARRSSQNFGSQDASLQNKDAQELREKAKARKEHMIRLEMEKVKKAKADKSRVPQKSKKINLEDEQNEDIVKLLNTCKQRTAAFAIRDKQLIDKAIREKEEKNYERLMDLEMEVNRIKDIAAREKEEDAKIKKRIADRKVIEDQIKEREHQRLLQEEARNQENQKMLETIKKYEDEDAEKERKRKEETRKSKMEIIKNNEVILNERKDRKAFEKQEEEMIIVYLAERDKQLRAREEEEAEEKRKKIELQKKLLESQTKLMDKRSEMDELRARRAAEENERKHRQRELQEAQKRKKEMDILHKSRNEQADERQRAKQLEIEEKKAEYNDTLRLAAEMAKRERDEAEIAKKQNAELRKMLQQQIEENEKKKKLLEQEKYKEGKETLVKMVSCYVHLLYLKYIYCPLYPNLSSHDFQDAEREKLETIRTMMVEDMKAKGVDEKYFTEMLTLDIKKVLSH